LERSSSDKLIARRAGMVTAPFLSGLGPKVASSNLALQRASVEPVTLQAGFIPLGY